MSIDSKHFRELIVRPTIKKLDLWSPAAEELLMLTWAQETHGATYLKQGWKKINDARGVGLGPYSMEPETHHDHWVNWLNHRPTWHDKVFAFTVRGDPEEMIGNLYYATAMARIHYYRIKERLPSEDSIILLAGYWDDHYNRNSNAGFPTEAVANYKRFVL